jgi:hypothetical protein
MARPRESRPLDVQTIPIDQVQNGHSLLIEEGGERLLFQVEAIGFSSKRRDDGAYASVITLTSGPVAGGGDPWVLEYPLGAQVCQIIGVTQS